MNLTVYQIQKPEKDNWVWVAETNDLDQAKGMANAVKGRVIKNNQIIYVSR